MTTATSAELDRVDRDTPPCTARTQRPLARTNPFTMSSANAAGSFQSRVIRHLLIVEHFVHV
jgi:hypothetical protein